MALISMNELSGALIIRVIVCSVGLYAFVKFFLLKKKTVPPKWKATGRAKFKTRESLKSRMAKEAPATDQTYLVIGTGFLGLSLVDSLLVRGETKVRGFDIKEPHRKVSNPNGFTFFKGDVDDDKALDEALTGVDVVYATFAIIRFYERLQFQYAESHQANVVGTEKVIAACIRNNVKVLVQTSTALVNVIPETCSKSILNETDPYVSAKNAISHYSWTKAQAEMIALKADGSTTLNGGVLRVAAARPCSGIFGPEEPYMLRYLRNGYVDIIDGIGVIDQIHVENVVWGHILVEKGLRENPSLIGGEAFCIAPERPTSLEDFHRCIKKYYEKRSQKKYTLNYQPYNLLKIIGYIVEALLLITRKHVHSDIALLTPATIRLLGLKFSFSAKKAEKLLGYKPLYTLEESIDKTVHDFFKMENIIGMKKEM